MCMIDCEALKRNDPNTTSVCIGDSFDRAEFSLSTIQQITDAIQYNTIVTVIKLDFRRINISDIDEADRTITDLFKTIFQTTTQIHYCGLFSINSRMLDAVLNESTGNLTLKSFEVAIDGTDCCRIMGEHMKYLPNLEYIRLYSSTPLSIADTESIVEIVTTCAKLTYFEFPEFCDSVDVYKLLANGMEKSVCKDLAWKFTQKVPEEGIQFIAKSLAVSVVTKFNIYSISQTALSLLAEAMKTNIYLTSLSISVIGSETEGTRAFFSALRSNHVLVSLYFSAENLKVPELYDFLSNSSSLQYLDLKGDHDLKDFADCLKHSEIKELAIHHWRLKNCDFTQFNTLLKNNPQLRSLEIVHGIITATDAQILADALRFNQSSIDLFIESTGISAEGNIILVNAMKENPWIERLSIYEGIDCDRFSALTAQYEERNEVIKKCAWEAIRCITEVRWIFQLLSCKLPSDVVNRIVSMFDEKHCLTKVAIDKLWRIPLSNNLKSRSDMEQTDNERLVCKLTGERNLIDRKCLRFFNQVLT